MQEPNFKDKILEGTKLAIERMLEHKAKEGLYVAISQNGKVVKLCAKDLIKRSENQCPST